MLLFTAIAAAGPEMVDVREKGTPERMVVGRARLDVDEVRLSGEVRLTLIVEGPAPLAVSPPRPLLTTPGLWRVREGGSPSRRTADGRETWTQEYRLSPLLPGRPEVPLGPVTVVPGSGNRVVLDWPDRPGSTFAVRVTTGINQPSPDALREPADIEPLPPPPPATPGESSGWFILVPVSLLVSAIALLLGRRRRVPSVAHDAAWALGELGSLNLSPDHGARVLRMYAEYRLEVPARRMTTPELIAALRTDGRMPRNAVTAWEAVLTDCDAARFSGTLLAMPDLPDRAAGLVQDVETTLQASRPRLPDEH